MESKYGERTLFKASIFEMARLSSDGFRDIILID